MASARVAPDGWSERHDRRSTTRAGRSPSPRCASGCESPWRHVSAVHREQRRPATMRNGIWSMDFVADQLADGRRFRALTVLDVFTRECLAIEIGQGLGGQDVAAALDRLRFERGLPQRIYCDNGPEFVSAAMDLWAYTNKVILDFSRRASRLTTRPSNPSTVASGRSASTYTGSRHSKTRRQRSMRFAGTTMSIILTVPSRALAPANTLAAR